MDSKEAGVNRVGSWLAWMDGEMVREEAAMDGWMVKGEAGRE